MTVAMLGEIPCLGSTGCQPVVAGSPAGNIFARVVAT
jgi:hypothetical protein